MKVSYNRLKIVLAEKNISQIVLAELMRVRPETVSRWVTNESQPYVSEMYEIARLLKANFQEMFVETKWDAGPSEAEKLKLVKHTEKKEKSKPVKSKTVGKANSKSL